MRTKKAFKNIVISATYQIVSIICGLILPRLILGAFGSTYNGVINSAKQFLSMISILNLGIAGATRVALYKTLANHDTLGTSRIVKATQIYMRKIAMIVVAYTILLMWLYPLISHNDLSPIEAAALIGIISMSTFAEYFFGITNKTLITADQSGYITYLFNIIATILNTVVAAVLIHIGCSVFVVYLGSSLIFFINPLCMSIYVKKKYKIIKKCAPDNSAIKNRGAVAFHSIANIVHENTDLLILTLFTDAKVISIYTVYYLVIGKIKSIMRIFTNGLEAAFGNMWVKKELPRLERNFRTFEYALYSFTCIVFSCVGLLIIPFIKLYTKEITDINYVRIDLAVLITLAEAVFCVRQPYVTLVQATGSYEQTKKGAAVEAILNIIISLVLAPVIGINGVIIGTLVANVFRTIQYSLYVSKYILKRSMNEIWCRLTWLVSTSAIICFIASITSRMVVYSTTWVGWFINGTVTFIEACLITVATSYVFYKYDLNQLLCVFLRMIKRKK